MQFDTIIKPSHYNFSGLEVKTVQREFHLDRNAYLNDALKYFARAGKKHPERYCEDIEKGQNRIKEFLKRLEENSWNDRNYYTSGNLKVTDVINAWKGHVANELLWSVECILLSQNSAMVLKKEYLNRAIDFSNKILKEKLQAA